MVRLYSTEETTGLISAVRADDIKQVARLLAEDANINVQDEDGNTALAVGARIGNVRTIKLLLAHHPSINKINFIGLTPLHQAVMRGHIEVAKLLLDHGADVNAVDFFRGRTPLLWVGRMTQGAPRKKAPHMPVETSVQLIKLLLERGADPARADPEGKTGLDWAIHARDFDSNIDPLVVVLSEAMKIKPEAEENGTVASHPETKLSKVDKPVQASRGPNPQVQAAPIQVKAPQKQAQGAKQVKQPVAGPKAKNKNPHNINNNNN